MIEDLTEPALTTRSDPRTLPDSGDAAAGADAAPTRSPPPGGPCATGPASPTRTRQAASTVDVRPGAWAAAFGLIVAGFLAGVLASSADAGGPHAAAPRLWTYFGLFVVASVLGAYAQWRLARTPRRGEIEAPMHAQLGSLALWWRTRATYAEIYRQGRPIAHVPVTGPLVTFEGQTYHVREGERHWNPTWRPKGFLVPFEEGNPEPLVMRWENRTRVGRPNFARILNFCTGDYLLWVVTHALKGPGVKLDGKSIGLFLLMCAAVAVAAWYFLEHGGF